MSDEAIARIEDHLESALDQSDDWLINFHLRNALQILLLEETNEDILNLVQGTNLETDVQNLLNAQNTINPSPAQN